MPSILSYFLCGDSIPSLIGTRTEANLDLQEVLAAAKGEADTACP